MTQQTKFLEVLIVRDTALAIPQKVAEWELPILEAAHPEVRTISTFWFDRPAPETDDEFQRLNNKYGRSENEDGSRGLPYVEAVYGQHGLGRARLAQAISAASREALAQDADDLMGEQVA